MSTFNVSDDGMVMRVDPASLPERAAFKRTVLAAFGVTPEELDGLKAESFERALAAAEADRSFATETIEGRRAWLYAWLKGEEGDYHLAFIQAAARAVGCPFCGKADPLDASAPDVCTCGFEWGEPPTVVEDLPVVIEPTRLEPTTKDVQTTFPCTAKHPHFPRKIVTGHPDYPDWTCKGR